MELVCADGGRHPVLNILCLFFHLILLRLLFNFMAEASVILTTHRFSQRERSHHPHSQTQLPQSAVPRSAMPSA